MNCKNCHTKIANENIYCGHCGARIIKNRLTLKNLFIHAAEQFFNYDNKFFKTIIHLFTNPKIVIGGYIDGVRKRYVNPISFFAIALAFSGLSIFVMNKFYSIDNIIASSKITKHNVELFGKIMGLLLEYSSLVNSAYIPFMAIMSLIVFYNKKYNLTEHSVIYLYSMSLFTIVSVVATQIILAMTPNSFILFSQVFIIPLIIYHIYLLKRVFTLSFFQIMVKTLIFIPILLIFCLLSIMVIIKIMILAGFVNLQDFAPPS